MGDPFPWWENPRPPAGDPPPPFPPFPAYLTLGSAFSEPRRPPSLTPTTPHPPTPQVLGFVISVVSATASPADIEARIDAFVAGYLATLEVTLPLPPLTPSF